MAESYSSIYSMLQTPPVRPFDPLEAAGQVTQLQAAQQRSAMGQLALAEAQAQRDREAQIRAAYRRAYSGEGATPGQSTVGQLAPQGGAVQETVNTPYGPDLQAMLTQYQQEGADVTPQPGARTLPSEGGGSPLQPPMARADRGGMPGGNTSQLVRDLYQIDPQAGQAAEQAARASQTAQLEMVGKQNAMVSQVARAILLSDTQEAYEAGVSFLTQMGIPTQHLPAMYDRRMVEHYYAMSTDAATRINEQKNVLAGQRLAIDATAQERLQKEYELDVQKYGLDEARSRLQERQATETERHHRATEGQQAETESRQQGQQTFERENTLRDEFNTLTKDYRTQSDAYGRVQASAADPSAAGDLSLIFAYMKLLDPGSVVREGEQATAANARGVDEGVRSYYNRVLTGERLAPEQRKDFVDRAQRLYDQATRDHTRIKTQQEAKARRYGVNPANVTTEYGSTAAPQQGGARVSRATVDKLAAEEKVPRATVIQRLRDAGLTVEE